MLGTILVNLFINVLIMRKIVFQLILTLGVSYSAFSQNAQRHCASTKFDSLYEQRFQKMLERDNQFANDKKPFYSFKIPVIFHIIHSGQNVGSSYNISQAQINSQLAILNQDFRKTNSDFSSTVTQSAFLSAAADCEITFCAAMVDPAGNALPEPGIDRILAYSKEWSNPPYSFNYIESTIKPGSSWDPTKYFNVWVVGFSDGMTLGYAQFPPIPTTLTAVSDMVGNGGPANTDGVVLNYNAVGNMGSATYPFNKGRTATHEIGHWLGLWHINGDSGCGNDFCSDTPAQSSLTTGCPSTTGGVSSSGCSASPNPPGKNYQNFMDYSDDRCMSMFTAKQKERMQAVLSNCVRRNTLNYSAVCNAVGIEENEASFNFDIFPNPAHGQFLIDIDLIGHQDLTVSVLNTLGQTIKEIKYFQSNTGSLKVDLSGKPAGIYFVSVKLNGVSKTKRLVVE
ncbi:MAG: hypothetical protein K0R26_477 [Bacteroidota bacterium]|jgi:hypothetical protein|nr:hypothetical protein [Bacteroidota bacterium]